MAVDKAVDSTILDGYFGDIADSIRAKAGTQNTYTPAQMSGAIDDIPSSNIGDYLLDSVVGGGSYSPAWQESIVKLRSPFTITQNCSYAFSNYPLANLPNVINCSGAPITLESMFSSCKNIETLPTINFADCSHINSLAFMFSNCSKLTSVDLSNLNLSSTNSINTNQMFSSCSKLTNIVFPNNCRVYNTNSMFWNCSRLTSLDITNIDTSGASTLSQMFYGCSKLVTLQCNLDFTSCTNTGAMFGNMKKLENIGTLSNVGKAYLTTQSANYNNYMINFGTATLLTHTSLMNIINGLYDIATKGVQPQQLVLGTNINKLTSDEIAIATNKGWTVS